MIDIRALEEMHEQVRQFAEARHPGFAIIAVRGDTALMWTLVSGVRHRFSFTASLRDKDMRSGAAIEVKVAVLEDGTLRAQETTTYQGI